MMIAPSERAPKTGAPVPAMTLALALALTAGAAGPGGSAVHAQTVRDLQHRSTFHESFGFLQTARELSDGRVLVADPLGGILAALDLGTGAMEPVGREGGGPGEWRQPDAVFPLAGDSTLLVDLGNARLSVVDPAGRIVHGYPIVITPQPPAGDAGGAARGAAPPGGLRRPGGPGAIEILHPRATDAAGRIYYQGRGRMVGPGVAPGAAPDSMEVRRWDRGDEAPVRLAGLRPPATTSTSAGGGGQIQVRAQPIPLSPQDDWAVAPDGRIALVRAEPYRVEWVDEGGGLVRGPVVDYAPVRVRTAEKERWVEERATGALTTMMTMQGGVTNTQFRRGGTGPGNQGGIDDYEWPEVLPAFRPGGTRVDPNGRVWVERFGAVGSPTTYDVFDARAARIATIRLPAGRRVIGFGRQAVYAVRVDDLGLHWLEVYDPPR